MRRVLSVFLPTWPTDRLRMKQGAPSRDKPFVTVRHEGTRRVLASVDAAAWKLKLRPGQTLAYARALIPHLENAEANEREDHQEVMILAQACLKSYSPIVALTDFHGLSMDISGCAHLYGSEQGLVDHLLGRMRAKNIAATAAIADTPTCANALALFANTDISIVPSGEQKLWLAELSLSFLRLPETVTAGLEKLGFTRIKHLYDVPRAPLVRRFGALLIQRIDQALGFRGDPLDPIEMPEIHQVKCNFTEPAANPDYIARSLKQLCFNLCEKLTIQNLGARKLDLIFHRVDNSAQAIRVGTVSPSHEPGHYMRLLSEHLDKVEYGFGIEALTLSAPLVENFQHKQYLNSLGETPKADLASLIDILQNRLGTSHVYQARAKESDVPERSVAHVLPLSVKNLGVWPTNWPRPARLLRNPERIDAMALLPDHAPRQFVWRHKSYRIKRADGPERIFGEWWNGHSEFMAVRDYFQVEDEQGGRFWLFRRGDGMDSRSGSHEWFMHGFFG